MIYLAVNTFILYLFGYEGGFYFPKQPKKSRSVLKDRSRFWGYFAKEKHTLYLSYQRLFYIFVVISRRTQKYIKRLLYLCREIYCIIHNMTAAQACRCILGLVSNLFTIYTAQNNERNS